MWYYVMTVDDLLPVCLLFVRLSVLKQYGEYHLRSVLALCITSPCNLLISMESYFLEVLFLHYTSPFLPELWPFVIISSGIQLG